MEAGKNTLKSLLRDAKIFLRNISSQIIEKTVVVRFAVEIKNLLTVISSHV